MTASRARAASDPRGAAACCLAASRVTGPRARPRACARALHRAHSAAAGWGSCRPRQCAPGTCASRRQCHEHTMHTTWSSTRDLAPRMDGYAEINQRMSKNVKNRECTTQPRCARNDHTLSSLVFSANRRVERYSHGCDFVHTISSRYVPRDLKSSQVA